MKFVKRICYSCCALIWAALVFASLLTREQARQVIHQHATTGSSIATANPTYDPLVSEMFVSSASEEIWDRNFQCFDKSTVFLTLAFDVGRKGLTNQHIALLHGFAVAYLLGAETIVEPRLWIGRKEISLQQLYDGTQISKALKELNIALLPDPPNNVETVDLELQINMAGGSPLRAICSRAQNVLRGSKAKRFLLHVGLAAGLLRVEESNLGLISFLDKHLEYNQGIQTATQNILKKLPTFNGLHLPETYNSYKTPKQVVPKLMEAGFHFDTTLFVASEDHINYIVPFFTMLEVPLEGLEAGAWLPYHPVTILNFSEETTMIGMDGTDVHLEFGDFWGPMNQLIMEKAINFTGFSLSNQSCAIAQHRWRSRGSCDKAYDSGTYFDGPSTPMFLWRGDWPWWPSCEKDLGGASQLPKQIVSQSCRLIFFAGIEGTGHHFWHALLPHLHPFTNWSENFSAQLYHKDHYVGFFSTYNETVRSIQAIRIKQLMADADRSIREQGGGILPLNVLSEGTSGMMSYPNLFGVDRALQYPNVHALAKLAEEAGVDLRIVLLVRHPGSVVRSGLKRHFERTQMHAIKMYTSALAFLSAQLSLLDPSFFACWRYEAPTVGISDLLQFMGSREDPDDFKQVVAKESKQGANEIGATPAALQTATALHSAMLSKYCNASLADDNVSSQKLPKQIVSQSCRFTFFAGIEGTGHHFWHGLLPHLRPFTNWSDNLSAELYSGDHKTGFFSTWDESIRSNHATRIKKVMADADRSIREQGGGIVPLNVLVERVSGMMSYPNFLGRTRALQNPDVPALAKLAEEAGVDLRIVLLLRHPKKVVHSGLKRGFEKNGLIHAISMYTSTLALLSTQLSLLDPSFIACWRYEAPNVGISDLLQFMGSREDPGDFKQMIAKQYRGGKKHAASAGDKLADEALQTATALHNELIAKYCKPRSAHAWP